MRPLKKIVDATGAGDAFLGGLIAGLYDSIGYHLYTFCLIKYMERGLKLEKSWKLLQ